jgi:hypothetical protein
MVPITRSQIAFIFGLRGADFDTRTPSARIDHSIIDCPSTAGRVFADHRHHFLDAFVLCRAGPTDFLACFSCAISATSCNRSSRRKRERPPEIVSNTPRSDTLVQAVGMRLSLPLSS